ncbi:hypothetical protein JRQ81_000625 [Phrynocephalus forsythii]|uniref:Uncharacterized protein n=1 Tax=Phrynocephalus forsythii TaxID=171643 RepID=A0A9Q0Y5M1_9SAUR|nr:hypothetical protein JRQ81_000625 [Phrynocephalus forsythii]
MAEAPRTRKGDKPTEEQEESSRGRKSSLQGFPREEWRVLGAGKSLPPNLLFGNSLTPDALGAEAGPSTAAQLEDHFLHLSIRKQVSYRSLHFSFC